MKTRASFVILKLAAIAMVTAGNAVGADNYPSRPMRIVVPFTPGGATDVVARVLGKAMSADMGQPVVIDNRGGAGGIIGIDMVAKSPADGYTLLVTQSVITILPSLQKKLPFDAVKDFAPVSTISSYMMTLVVLPSNPLRNVKQLITMAKAKPGQITYGSSGAGGLMHLSGELFDYSTGTSMTHVPYKGQGQVVTDVLGGQLVMCFASPAVLPFVKSQKLVAVAVTGAQRWAALPDVPTVAESGVPGYEATSWNAMFAPAGTPPAVINRLGAALKQAMAQQDARDVLDAQGLDIALSSPQELAAMVQKELAKWAKLIAAVGLKSD